MKYTIATAAALVGAASARQCQNLTIPIHASARNGVFNITAPQNNIEVTNFILDQTQQGHNNTAENLQGYKTVSGNYSIAATYCQPDKGPANVLQVLTHGIGFDRSYWDLSIDNGNYSYVKEAVDEYGYSTFSWDRLGIGMSSHGEPVNEIQALLEVDALRALTEMLRAGEIAGISKKFETVVHVGHSFGSEHTYALTAMYPDISDGIALTGFSQNGTFIPYFALGGNFVDAPTAGLTSYTHGYLAAGDPTGVQINFFAPGDFDPALLQLAYSTGQPVTIGELLTIGGETGSKNYFCKPTLIITGERDIPYCGGDCLNPPTGYSSIPATSANMIPNAQNFTVDIVPGAGHGLNLQYSHTYTYEHINNYFESNGLAANAAPKSKTCPSSATASSAASSTAAASASKTGTASGAAASATGHRGGRPVGWHPNGPHGWGGN